MTIKRTLSLLFQNTLYDFHYLIFAVPMGSIFCLALLSYKSLIIAEIIHFIFFMIVLGIQYQAFFLNHENLQNVFCKMKVWPMDAKYFTRCPFK